MRTRNKIFRITFHPDIYYIGKYIFLIIKLFEREKTKLIRKALGKQRPGRCVSSQLSSAQSLSLSDSECLTLS